MKRMLKITYLVLFFAACLLPSLGMLVAPTTESAEKRELAELPSLTQEDGSWNLEFFDQLGDYFDDHFTGRNQLIYVYNRLMADVFGVSGNDQVIVGKDGFLFFSRTLGDYDGSGDLSATDRGRMLYNLQLLSEILEQNGTPLIVAIAPNKNTVYADQMPDYLVKREGQSNYAWLLEHGDGLRLIDLPALLQPEDGVETYYTTDSHWNTTGARIAAMAIAQEIEACTGVSTTFGDGSSTSSEWTGDLSEMLFPLHPTVEPSLLYEDAVQAYEIVGRMPNEEAISITTQGGEAELSVLVLRDSFSNSLLPFLSNRYQHVHYSRQMPFALDLIQTHEADVVVLEMAERRLSELVDAAPVIAAPQSEPFAENGAQDGLLALCLDADNMGRTRIYGAAPSAREGLQSLCVQLTDGDGNVRCYQAFAAYESTQFEEPLSAEQQSGAFSLLVEGLSPGDYRIALRQQYQDGSEAVFTGTLTVPAEQP